MENPEVAGITASHKTFPPTINDSVHDPINRQVRGQQNAKTANTGEHQLEYGYQLGKKVQTTNEQYDLEEIENILRSHEAIKDAIVLPRHGPEADIVGFVTLKGRAIESHIEKLKRSDNEYETQQVQLWETVFDRGIYTAIDGTIQPESIGRDFTGWVSAYNGDPLDKGDMNEWLEDTIGTILTGDNDPQLNVLELGTGSGMILFSIAKRIRSYLGLEPSRTAVEFVNATAKTIPELAGKVCVYQGTAIDFHLLGPASPDVVVINSVAQYFPSLDYLSDVIEGILQFDSVQRIFFGDIRSYALQREFLVGKALHKLGEKATKDKVREEMREMAQAELELLVDPAFFTSLSSQFPEVIEHVEILPKKMRANNELSCYRYAAIIHAKKRNKTEELEDIHEVKNDEWIDFMHHQLSHETLLRRLEVSALDIVAVCNIPYSKTIFERHVIEHLYESAEDQDVDWLSAVRQRSQKYPSFSALDLVALSKQAGCRVEISWARQHSQHGGLDAIFHHYQPSGEGKTLFRFPADHQGRAASTFANQPLQHQVKQTIQQHLYETLQAQLPEDIVLEDIHILEKLPMNANSEVDRQALAKIS